MNISRLYNLKEWQVLIPKDAEELYGKTLLIFEDILKEEDGFVTRYTSLDNSFIFEVEEIQQNIYLEGRLSKTMVYSLVCTKGDILGLFEIKHCMSKRDVLALMKALAEKYLGYNKDSFFKIEYR